MKQTPSPIRTKFIMESTTNLRKRIESPSKTVANVIVVDESTSRTIVKPSSYSTSSYLIFLLLTVLLGSIYSLTQISPDVTSFRSRLPAHQLTTSPPPSYTLPVPSVAYFANKSNVFNQLFVKKGWAWTSGIWLLFILVDYFDGPIYQSQGLERTIDLAERKHTRDGRLKRELVRFGKSSLIWYYLTQATWFLFALGKGPSVYHKVLLATGARCQPSSLGSTPNTEGLLEEVSAMCSRGGEYWKG